ncbi:hypothetical protein ACLKA7_001315 [Drosophila subpalustris]
MAEHQEHLPTVLQILRKHGLCVNLSKCDIAKTEVRFLSYIINQHGIKPPTDRIEAIVNYTRSDTIMQLAVDLAQFKQEQEADPELEQLLHSDSSLKLQRVRYDDNTSIYCDVSTGMTTALKYHSINPVLSGRTKNIFASDFQIRDDITGGGELWRPSGALY